MAGQQETKPCFLTPAPDAELDLGGKAASLWAAGTATPMNHRSVTRPATPKQSKSAARRRGAARAYERAREPLAPRTTFYRRLTVNLALGLGIIVVSLAVGVLGYRFLGHLEWIDAFVDAAMILSGMGPVSKLADTTGKLFAGLYALYSGFALLATAGVIFAPVLHRFLHRFHLEDEQDEA